MSTNVHATCVISGEVLIDNSAKIGPNCLLIGVLSIGPSVILQGGVTLIGNAIIENDVSIDSGVCIATDKSKAMSPDASILISEGVHVGAGCILYQGVVIGRYANIRPGSVVSRDIPPYAIVSGNPAVITGYTSSISHQQAVPTTVVENPDVPGIYPLNVRDVVLYNFKRIHDLRGDLTVGEFERNIPFTPKRYFLVFDVPSYETRGEHAHRKCHQFLICPSGSVAIVVDDGSRRQELTLNSPNLGLLVPPGIWCLQYKYSSGSSLLVFASEFYDPEDYIRNYDDFTTHCKSRL